MRVDDLAWPEACPGHDPPALKGENQQTDRESPNADSSQRPGQEQRQRGDESQRGNLQTREIEAAYLPMPNPQLRN
ncbi:hypothetical protein GCM10027040_35740 [Halomonas shantousis]